MAEREALAAQKKTDHTGHRSRLYRSYLNAGLDGFSDVVVLELLLSYAIPRRDTNGLAHVLLDTFGSLHGVLDAKLPQLCAVPGMTERAAILLHLQTRLWQRYRSSQDQSIQAYTDSRDCAALLCRHMRGLHEEQVWMLSLDAKCRLLDCRRISEGSVSYSALPPRRVLEAVLQSNASSVMLAHNHISGVALPSKEDVELTRLTAQTLRSIDVRLIDHIIVAEEDYVSMQQSGLL